ncbi:hypothetical protein D0869_09918 [Hortaea werneckii]|uniref:Uncharacterized protein n=1 Tax=Hortaea werneckii TaxID=91943 RepID=A0A3M6WG63_HORWE|nr:hypothetical protein KC355_g6969 [Hortaea werneckii]KAI7559966.1 hypothetical protein KC316_g13045 [Hortaea werneckii]RMX77398.1 hypothetical protein D0869_09918 [Hortaea werneckii]RMX99066.1 hypothetical protein D0868_09734 [Hortaea werneckii]RMY05308.1 hypothetical protein D0866_15217 [Hortaea werneckii]
MGLIDSLRSKYELYRLEQRYTRRDKRTTFASGAQYVDGEYIYSPTPTSTGSTTASGNSSSSATKSNGFGASVVGVKEVFGNSRRGSRIF